MGRYTAGLHTSVEDTQAEGDAPADMHPSVSMRGIVERLPAAVAAKCASAYDVLEQIESGQLGGGA
ncbi:hypothetical protein [Frankia sp. CiP3]|uniref:hypothetical protein n=1 Tax=Frankia sp. CiP3 TaxID=2880971 RepID=UPI001EF5DE96|nr:hypothetical protein [Frankia sp. CiP3]